MGYFSAGFIAMLLLSIAAFIISILAYIKKAERPTFPEGSFSGEITNAEMVGSDQMQVTITLRRRELIT